MPWKESASMPGAASSCNNCIFKAKPPCSLSFNADTPQERSIFREVLLDVGDLYPGWNRLSFESPVAAIYPGRLFPAFALNHP